MVTLEGWFDTAEDVGQFASLGDGRSVLIVPDGAAAGQWPTWCL